MNYYENIGVDTLTSNYYKTLADLNKEEYEDIACVRAEAGDIFKNKLELKLIKHKQVMKTKDQPKQKKAMKEEHGNFKRCDVVTAVPNEEVLDDTTIIGSAWEIKNKYMGTHRDGLNARTRHCDIKDHFLIELKEKKIIEVDWIKGEENKSDILSKNVTVTIFDKTLPVFCGYGSHLKQILTKDFQTGRVFDMF